MKVPFLYLLALVVLAGGARAGDPPPTELAALLFEARDASPDLRAAEARTRAAETVPDQLEALPDPRLTASYTNDGLSGFTLGSSEFSNIDVRWEQDVPFRAARAGAADVARADLDVVRRTAMTLQARLHARVIVLYADLWRADRMDSLLARTHELLATALESERVRYEAGQGTQRSVLRAQTELRRIDLRREEWTRRRRGAEIALDETLGRTDTGAYGPAHDLPGLVPGSDPGAAARTAGDASPETGEARAREARADAAAESARRASRAEFSWMAGYQFRGGLDPMVMGGLGVRLPVRKDRRQGQAIAQADAEAEAARLDLEASRNAVLAQARDLASEVDSLDTRLRLYRDAVLPEAYATVEAARAALSVGRIEMNILLDDTTRLLALEEDSVDLEARRVQALALLESLTGASLLDLASVEVAR